MSSRIREYFRRARVGRLLLRTALAVFVCLLLMAALVAALPAIVSSAAVQSRLQRALGASLKRTVTWSKLELSWSEGLYLKKLVLGSGPAPLLKASVGDVAVVPVVAYRDGRFRVDLDLRVTAIAADLAPGPPKPPKPYQEPLTALAEAVQRFQGMDWPLPLDLGVKAVVEPMDIAYADPGSGRSLSLRNAGVRLEMPSLADRPVRAEFRGDLAVDGHRPEPLSFTAELRQLVTPGRRIRPAGATLALSARFPGSTLTLQGGLASPKGVVAQGRFDLSVLTTALGPFLPATVPTVRGGLALELHAAIDADRNLGATVELNGTGIALSGGALRQGHVGPLALRLHQRVASDYRRQQVRLTDGRLTVGTLLDAGWEATVDRPASKGRDLSARIGPVRLDLEQALALARPLLKKPLPVTDLTGELRLNKLSVRLEGEKRGEVRVAGLTLDLPRLRLRQAKGAVIVDALHAELGQASVPLESMRPTRADARIAWNVKRCAVSGSQPVVLEGMGGGLQVTITDLDLKSRSPRKVSGRVDLTQMLDLERVNLSPRLTVDGMHEQLAARLEARDSGELAVELPELRISAASLRAVAGSRKLSPLPLTAVLTAAGIRVPADKGGVPSVGRASLTLGSGDAVKLAAVGSLASGTAATTGTLRLDLDRALPLAAVFLPKGASAGGVTTLAWNLAAPVKVKPPAREKNPLRLARSALGLLDRGELTVTLANRGIAWPLAGGKVSLAELRTPRPVRLELPAPGRKVRVGGEIAFNGLTGLPGAAAKLPPQGGTLSLDGELNDWQSLSLRENLTIVPLGLAQKADLAIGRLAGLMELEKIDTTALLQRLDASVTTDLSARFPATLTPVPGGVELAGGASANLQLDLAGGRNLRVRASAATRDLGLRVKNGTTVEGMTADLLFDRTYALARGQEAGWTPLSASLVRPLPTQGAAAGAAELANRVREDLRGQVKGSRRFTIRKVTVADAKVPLELTALEGDLLLTPEEMGLSFFQTDLLGGTMRLRGMIDLKAELPAVSAACSFSNLETDRLLPADVRRKSLTKGEESAVTGELSLDAPLATGQRELLEGVRMRLNLRRIGRETLERALFSLDPYERNEQVVAQRKLLRNGNLNWLRAGTLDGSFSLEGEVQVKGITVALPPVERIRLADLPLKKQMAATLGSVKKLRAALDLMRADTIRVSPEGKLSLTRRNND